MIKENKIHFDSEINNPVQEAVNIIMNYKEFVSSHLVDKEKFKKQSLIVLNERLINNKTLDEVGLMLNVTRERIRQIEIRLKEILIKKMKGLYYDKRNTQII